MEGVRGWFPVATLDLSDRLLLAAVVLLPWAFGGTEIWAYRLAGLLVILAGALRAGAAARGDWALGRVRLVLIPAALLLALAVFQLLPLPPSILAALSPRAHEIYSSTFPGYAGEGTQDPIVGLEALALERVPEAADVALPRDAFAALATDVGGRWNGWRPVSLVPAFTLERVFWFVPLLLAFLMFHARARDEARRTVFEAVLFLDFLALSLFGLVHAATGNGKLYWIRATVQDANPFGPFVNPTNFAALMELAVPWVLASAWASRRLRRSASLPFPILLATGACCALAGLLTGSRAGVVLIGFGLAAVLFLIQERRVLRWTVGAGIAVVAAVGALVFTRGGWPARLLESGAGANDVERLSGWRAALEMLSDFSWTGVGVGAFRDVFPVYAPAGGYARLAHLHNDYLEIMVETGWPGTLLLFWAVAAYVAYALRRSGRGLAGQGLLVGLVCLFVHAAVDFNHQIPAIALYFVAAAGIAVARERRP